jgi:hypothetical membrane protein
LFALIYPGYDIVNISEFGAFDSPIKTLANVFGFSLFGIFIMIFAIGIFRSNELNKFGKISASLIFLTGILMYLVGIFPCDTGCENFSVLGDLHERASNYQFPILALGLIFFVLSSFNNEKLRWLAGLIVVLGLTSLALGYVSMLFQGPIPYPGIIQRLAIGLPYLLMMIIAFAMYRNSE